MRANAGPDDLQAPPIRADGLQVEEERDLQRVVWTVERVAWAGFAVVLLAALAGLTGSGGPLAHRTLELGPGAADLPRIARWQTPETVVLSASGADRHVLLLDAAFDAAFSIEAIHPQPVASAAGAAGTRLDFAAVGEAPQTIHLDVRPRRPGFVRYRLDLDGTAGEAATLVLP